MPRGFAGRDVSPVVDSMIPPSDFRRTGEGNGNEEKEGGEGEEEEEKKEATLYLPLTERTEEETIVEYEVEYKLSWGDRVGNQSTSCLSPSHPFLSVFHLCPSPFPSPSLCHSFSLFQTLPDVSPVIGWAHCTAGKKLGEFRFAVTNSLASRTRMPLSDATVPLSYPVFRG